MFDPEGEDASQSAKPPAGGLEEVKEGESADAAVPVDSNAPKKQTMMVKNLARGGEVTELGFVDPAMAANTNPFMMSWWAYPLFGFPFVLLADDAFHFLPKDGPLGFLGTL